MNEILKLFPTTAYSASVLTIDVTTRGNFRRAANSAAQIALFTARLHHAGAE